jgi:putative ABC transport system ATP-binding protein
MAVLELKAVSRVYRIGGRQEGGVTVKALGGVDLSVEEGEFVSIMGPSGSGKSTLMNILGCLDKPDEGSYCLDGIETSSFDSDTFALIRNKKIGFVFQAFNLLPRTTALENVELPLFYNRKSSARKGNPERGKRWQRERAAGVLREVGLGDRMDHLPSQLSGGQQQRAAIARAIVNDPAFILADEPTGNLDTEMGLEIMGLFQALNGKGKTIIMVTHEPELAAYTKRTITLRDGKLVSDQPVRQRKDAAEELPRFRALRAEAAFPEDGLPSLSPGGPA